MYIITKKNIDKYFGGAVFQAAVQYLATYDSERWGITYLAAVEERRASFTPFVVYVDGVLGHDAQHLIKRLCDQIAMKWEKSHSEVIVWVRARIAFAILPATNLCLRGSRVKWRSGDGMDDAAGLPHSP